MNRPYLALVIGSLLLGAASRACAQQYPFLPIPGSPKNVRSVFQDSRGRLWIGADDVACFDGSRFLLLSDYGFPKTAVFDIAEDSRGDIWIASNAGIFRFATGRVEQVAKGIATAVVPATPDIAVAETRPDAGGPIEESSLLRIERAGRAWTTHTIMPLDSPGPLTLDHSGHVLYPWPGTGWKEFSLDDIIHWRPGLPLAVASHRIDNFPGVWPMKVIRDRFGCVWVGASSGNTYDCGDGRHAVSFDAGTLNSQMHEAPDGTMVLRGPSVLAIGRPGSFRVATPVNGMPEFEDAVETRDGTVWLATVNGLYRCPSPFRIEYWAARDGIINAPWSITRSGGKMYAGLNRRIVVLGKDRSKWELASRFQDTGDVLALLGSEDGNLVAAFQSGPAAALLSASGKILAATRKGDPPSGMRLLRTPDGQVWMGGKELGRLVRKGSLLEWTPHPLATQPSGYVLGIRYQNNTRRLWACYNGGLVLRDEHGAWSEFNTRDGLLTNGCWSVVPLPNGDIWYDYFGPGIALLRPTAQGRLTIRQYGVDSKIPEPGCDLLDADANSRLWRGGITSFYVADPAAAEDGNWLQLDQLDGFPEADMNTGSFFADPDGSVWFGLNNYLAHYDPPQDLVNPPFAPQIFLSAFSWENSPPRLAESVNALPHGARSVAHIGSLQFDRRNALRLRYRVLPGQPEWRETRSLDLPLAGFATGAHTLEVQGRVFTGPWSRTIGYSFTVLPPVWLAWPFLPASSLAGILAMAGAYLLYRRARAEQAQILPDLAEWRIRALLPDVHEVEGTLLDSRFEVKHLLARGGFANVMDGYDHTQGQRCAIKIFRTEIKNKTWIERSFDQEVAALKRVRHPNVVTIYAHGRTPSAAPYLVMEFIEGERLRDVLASGALPPRRAARLLAQLAEALDAIHAEGICHRDVTPENIIVRNSGNSREQAILIDFSIAIVKDGNETLHGLSRAAGTFDYMAPEQAMGYAQPSSDVYSLAKVFIEMVTGLRLKDLLPDASLDLPERISEWAQTLNLSPGSKDMLASALQFDPGKRPSVATVFASPLVRDLESGGRKHAL